MVINNFHKFNVHNDQLDYVFQFMMNQIFSFLFIKITLHLKILLWYLYLLH